MELLEKDIEDIIYDSPWLLDERFDIPNIKGKVNRMPGRQVNVGGSKLNRYIDLLFRDTRDNRPVIIELKKGDIVRENIAQILEYRALVISLEEENRIQWVDAFGNNYYCPKLILIGNSATEETRISANLAGVEIRTLSGEEKLEVEFTEIAQITHKLNEWNNFRKSGNRTLEDRDDWVREIYEWVKDVVNEYNNEELTTIKKVYETSRRDSWIEGWTFPFINLPIFYKGNFLVGIYEYYDTTFCYSDAYLYFDFYIQHYNEISKDSNESINKIKLKAKEILENKKYSIIKIDDGFATIKLERISLENVKVFKEKIASLISDAIYLNEEIDKFELIE